MRSKTKLKNAAIAARSAALPKIPRELLDQLVQGPMTAESIQDVTSALKKALIERACGNGVTLTWVATVDAISKNILNC